jgi:hypothetical protein
MKEPTKIDKKQQASQQAHKDFLVRPVAFAGNGVWTI